MNIVNINHNRKEHSLEYFLVLCAIAAASAFIHIELSNSKEILYIGILAIFVVIFAWKFTDKFTEAVRIFFRHRWCIAAVIFLLCCLLRISGSSIGVYDEIFTTQIDASENTIFGIPRWIRSDEYGVQTMKFFSQEYNDYHLFSRQMSISDTNMVLDYYSPVMDITAIGKPLMWGYLLFGSEIGLSWYWCGMIILIFMTALEMLLILTRGNTWVSCAGAFVILLAPSIQWWVMPHMPIVFLYAMALFCIGYYFFIADSAFSKWFFSLLAIIAVTGFALSLFPSFQVPCVYAIIVLLSVCLWRDRSLISFKKSEWYRIALPVAAVSGILIYFVLVSGDGLSALLNTAYPGKRVSTGGQNTWRDLFTDLTSLFLPYSDVSSYSNNCETSTFIHFGPFFFVLFPRIFVFLRAKKSSDLPVGTALFVIFAAFAFYMCIGIPEWLAKITFLKYCNRMEIVCGWIETLFTIWGIHIFLTNPGILNKWQKFVYPAAYGFLWALTMDNNIIGYFRNFGTIHGISIGNVLLTGEIVIFSLILLFMQFGFKRVLYGWIAVIMVVAGFTVNPIERGIGAVTNHPISQKIREISSAEPDACWLCTDCTFFLSNFVLANGARVINATNFYPDFEKWEIVDSFGKYEEYTNRYANQSASLTDGAENTVSLVAFDNINYALTPETLIDLHIEYLFSTVDYTKMLGQSGITCTLVTEQNGYSIYHLSY